MLLCALRSLKVLMCQNPSGIETHGINADSAILNPMTEIIALKGVMSIFLSATPVT